MRTTVQTWFQQLVQCRVDSTRGTRILTSVRALDLLLNRHLRGMLTLTVRVIGALPHHLKLGTGTSTLICVRFLEFQRFLRSQYQK